MRFGGCKRSLLYLIPGLLLLLNACASTLSKGQTLMEAGNYDEAVQLLMQALVKDPQSPEIRIKLAQAIRLAADAHFKRATELEETGNLEAALEAYRRTLFYRNEEVRAKRGVERVTNKRRALELSEKGKEFLDKGEIREAARLLEEARGLYPDHKGIEEQHQEATGRLKLVMEEAAKEKEANADERALSFLSDKPVTLRFKETDIKDVMEVFSKLAGANILLDEAIGAKKVTLYVKDLPLRRAFALALQTNRLFIKRTEDNPHGASLIVIPDTPAKRQQYEELMVRTFYLSKVDAKVAVNLVRTILNTRQIFVNEKLNAVVVRDTPEKIALVERLLQANDRGGGEVEIDLEILEVDRTKLRDLGIFFTDSYQAFFPFGDLTKIKPFATIEQFQNVQAKDLAITNPSLLLNLIKTDTEAKTLANPTLRVLDRQKASILIGERRPFQISQLTSTTATTATPGTQPSGTIQETRVEFRDVGLKLTITPIIHLDNEVTVELNFEISSIGELVGGSLLPSVNTRSLNTFIKVKDGETRLLGGLIQDEFRKTIKKSPILSEIPILGRLFEDVREDKVRRDIVISLTPRLVKIIEMPAPAVAGFWSGTAESFGPALPALPVSAPTPAVPPVPPAVQPPAPPPPGTPPQ